MLSRDEELALHQRLLDGDPAAPNDCVALCFPIVYAALARRRIEVRDPHLVEEAAGSALLDYVRRPESYRPERGPLLGFLTMAADRDLKNALARERRHRLRAVPLADVEHALPGGNEVQEADEIELPPGVTRAQALAELWRRVKDPRDRRVLELMMVDEVRENAVYARLLGITHLDHEQRDREVKRVKDRLKKVVRRLGEWLRDNSAS